MQLQLTKSPSAEDVVDALVELGTAPTAECELTLPSTFVARTPFDYADYLQVVFTWGARPGTKVLRVHARDAAGARAQLKGEHIQIAAALADRIVDLARNEVTSDAVDESAKRLAHKRAIQPRAAGVRAPVEQMIVEASRFPELAHSPDLTAADGRGSLTVGSEARALYGWIWPRDRYETLLANASSGEVVVSTDGTKHVQRQRWPDGHPYLSSPGKKIPYRTLAERLVTIHESAQQRRWAFSSRPHRAEDDLGAAVFELSQNAHNHGARDRRNAWLPNQVRVLRTTTRRFDRDYCREVAESSRALAGWMARHLDTVQSESSEMAIIDIVDNGIGLAQRAASLLGEYGDLDDRKEFEYLKRALAKSTRQGAHRMSAEGLARVQLLMTDLGGAVSIRSGRIALFRDFIRTPYRVGPLDLFSDWIPDDRVAERPARRGSVVTIIIPTR